VWFWQAVCGDKEQWGWASAAPADSPYRCNLPGQEGLVRGQDPNPAQSFPAFKLVLCCTLLKCADIFACGNMLLQSPQFAGFLDMRAACSCCDCALDEFFELHHDMT